jgi:hypothetical protein
MIRQLVLTSLFVFAGCNSNVSEAPPNTPPPPDSSYKKSHYQYGPLDPDAPCGNVNEPCCLGVDTIPACLDGLVCDWDSQTCLGPDMATAAPDMATTSVADLSTPPDLTTLPDLTSVADLTTLPDLTLVADLTTMPDMSTPPDLTTLPDLVVLPDLTLVADMTTLPDMTPTCTNVVCPDTYTCIDGQCIPPSCDYNQNCTFSYGYWKNHWVCNWQQVMLGTITYNHDQLNTILQTPSSGSNDLIELAHQLIGAKMNIVRGADPTSIQSTINAADALIGNLVVPNVGTGVLNSADAVSLATTLANYNLGYMGSPHCP